MSNEKRNNGLHYQTNHKYVACIKSDKNDFIRPKTIDESDF